MGQMMETTWAIFGKQPHRTFNRTFEKFIHWSLK